MPDNQPAYTSPNAEEAADQSPADRLKELQEDLKEDEEELAKLTKKRDALKADVESLGKTVSELEKLVAAYAKARPQLSKDRDTLNKYQSDMRAAAESVLGPERKQKVIDKIKDVEDKIAAQRKKVEDARKNVNDTGKAASEAQADLDSKQKAYDDFKNLEKELGDNLKKLNTFKTKIDTLNDVPKAASMYVLLREMSTVLGNTNVLGEKEFEEELTKRWTALEAAKEKARTARLAFENAKIQLAAEESALAALEKSRVDDLIAATDEFNK